MLLCTVFPGHASFLCLRQKVPLPFLLLSYWVFLLDPPGRRITLVNEDIRDLEEQKSSWSNFGYRYSSMAKRDEGRKWYEGRFLNAKDSEVTDASKITVRESLWPLFLVTILYFLWGFAYGLLDTLNKHFQKTLGINLQTSAGLQAAYFGAYLPAACGYANWVLRHYGYKATFMLGLTLFGIGALCMWPAGLNRSFGGFCAATFVIGSGLGSLETAANPFMAVTGPPRYAELRINLAQSFQAIGTIVGPVLGSYAFFKETLDDVQALKNVQWVYLAIAIFVFSLAVVFFLSRIPEVTDGDMAYQATETHVGSGDKPFRKQYRLFHAALAQFAYCGAQVAIAGYFINYIIETRADTDAALGAKLLAGAQGMFAVGRFSGSFLMRYVARPRWVFFVYLSFVIAFLSASITSVNNSALAMMFLTFFFESICFPTIVALGIRGLGRHTKRGSGLIVGAVAGGAVVPPILGAVADARGIGFAMVVPACWMVVAWTYAVAVNFVPSYRIPADAFGQSEIGMVRDVEEKGRVSDVEKAAMNEHEYREHDGLSTLAEVEKRD